MLCRVSPVTRILCAAILFYFFNLFTATANTQEFCGVRIISSENITFSKTEKSWLCGNSDSPEWNNIPPWQKKIFLKNYLQSRGFHKPVFHESTDLLTVETGIEQKITSFEIKNAPPEINSSKNRQIIEKKLTPTNIDIGENWVKRELQSLGYPCPNIITKAFTDTGKLTLAVDSGPIHYFGKIKSEGGIDLPYEILDRYTAFVDQQKFNIQLLELSSRRILNDDLYISTYYDVLCDKTQKPTIIRRFIPALPRLFTFGVGFDTEQGPILRSRYRRVRIGHAANAWESILLASFKEQSLNSFFLWSFSSNLDSRLVLIPRVELERLNETHFETNTIRFSTMFGNGWEKEDFSFELKLGPLLERINIKRGPGRTHENNIKIASNISARSHMFEYFINEPRTGWSFALNTNSQIAGFLSEQTVHKININHHTLFNIHNYNPPFLIIGWRGSIASYFLNQREDFPIDIPINDRFFLGGDENIRGFGRKSLPNDNFGFLTAIYQGIEFRAGDWYTFPIKPLLFFDIAKAGTKARHINGTLYYAPGFGARYNSPFGTIRSTLGYGRIIDNAKNALDKNLQFFFSLGREF